MSFTFGPEWARDTGCCAKPIGCTNTGPACLMLNHPWKRRHAMATDDPMRQEAPYPHDLADLVDGLTYKEHWRIWLEDMDRGQGSKGLTLVIQRYGPDSYNPGRTLPVNHFMPVPPAAFNRRSWQRWLFDQFLLVEQHEAAEFFCIDGARPYAPLHGPGNSPYLIAELAADADRRTSFRGELNPESP